MKGQYLPQIALIVQKNVLHVIQIESKNAQNNLTNPMKCLIGNHPQKQIVLLKSKENIELCELS